MKYFRLIDDVNIRGRWHLGEVIDGGNNTPTELWRGVRIQAIGVLWTDLTRPGKPLPFSLTGFAVPVANAKLADVIASAAKGDLQRLPIVIPGHSGYEVLNSTRVVRCVDEKRSEFTKWRLLDNRPELTGQYRMVSKLKIDPELVPSDANFFRPEGWRIALLVSETVMSEMEQCGCLGAKFESVT